jgi:hypothetical protein
MQMHLNIASAAQPFAEADAVRHSCQDSVHINSYRLARILYLLYLIFKHRFRRGHSHFEWRPHRREWL